MTNNPITEAILYIRHLYDAIEFLKEEYAKSYPSEADSIMIPDYVYDRLKEISSLLSDTNEFVDEFKKKRKIFGLTIKDTHADGIILCQGYKGYIEKVDTLGGFMDYCDQNHINLEIYNTLPKAGMPVRVFEMRSRDTLKSYTKVFVKSTFLTLHDNCIRDLVKIVDELRRK